MQIIEITGIEEPFLVYNIYNKKQQIVAPTTARATAPALATASGKLLHTVERFLLNSQIMMPTLLTGDFNLYHTW